VRCHRHASTTLKSCFQPVDKHISIRTTRDEPPQALASRKAARSSESKIDIHDRTNNTAMTELPVKRPKRTLEDAASVDQDGAICNSQGDIDAQTQAQEDGNESKSPLFASHPAIQSPTMKRIRGGGDEWGGDDDFAEMEQPYPDFDDSQEMEIPEDILQESHQQVRLPESALQRWRRPLLYKPWDAQTQDLDVQWLDMDVVTGAPLRANPNPARSEVVGRTEGSVPILRCFGVDPNGHSAAIFIHGFTPYAYFALEPEYQLDTSEENMSAIRQILTKRLQDSGRNSSSKDTEVIGIQYITDCKSLSGYETKHTRFLKIYVSLPGLVPTLKRFLEDGMELPGLKDPDNLYAPTRLCAFEANVPFVLRFMVDHELSGAGWMSLPAGTYQLRTYRESHCQIEVDVSYDDIVARPSTGEWNKMAPLRILSMDIECQGRRGHFPEAEKDPVIQIANCVSVYGKEQPIVQNVFTLKGCLPIVGAQVYSSDTEAEMLLKWRKFLEVVDPDIITGYNVQNFDIPYLLDRASTLLKDHKQISLGAFPQWGRIQKAKAKMKNTTFESAAYGKRNNVETTIEGRVVFDMLPYMQRNHKLSSYSLNAVCSEYLNQQKEDVHHSIISDLQNGSDEDRHRLATYCLKDAQLPWRLMERLSVLVNYIEMARVTGVPVDYLISRGQQIKVYSMILRKCQKEKLLVPTPKKSGFSGENVGYEGATVLEPEKGYYKIPIATLDFASLYPSIMQAYNLCYSTLIDPKDVPKVDAALYKKSENGHVFVHSHVKKGILPSILDELLSARKRAKKDMKNAATDFERAVQNGRQLALKVSANSVYGFTGATVGQLPCVPVASSVTSYGRILLLETKKFVTGKYTKANGYAYDAEVIYGDTDSVMVKFGPSTVAEVFPLALEAAEKASEIFPNPIQCKWICRPADVYAHVVIGVIWCFAMLFGPTLLCILLYREYV
jgi:DNA polymerase delta subunit 1